MVPAGHTRLEYTSHSPGLSSSRSWITAFFYGAFSLLFLEQLQAHLSSEFDSDNHESLLTKVLGTYQTLLTSFKYSFYLYPLFLAFACRVPLVGGATGLIYMSTTVTLFLR